MTSSIKLYKASPSSCIPSNKNYKIYTVCLTDTNYHTPPIPKIHLSNNQQEAFLQFYNKPFLHLKLKF